MDVSANPTRVAARPAAVSQISRGKTAPDDPQFGIHPDTEPLPDEALSLLVRADGDGRPYVVRVGTLALTMIETPGHTPGALSWQWQSCEGETCYSMVYADSLSPVSADDYKFSEHQEYLAAYRAGLERLSRVDCDILLTPHPSHSRMLRRMRTDAMIDATACAYYAIGKFQDIERRLEREAGANQ